MSDENINKYVPYYNESCDNIGKAFAGHAASGRDIGNKALKKKVHKYENALTDLINIVIAETNAKQTKTSSDIYS